MKSSGYSLGATSQNILEGGKYVDIRSGGFHFNIDGKLGKDMSCSAIYV